MIRFFMIIKTIMKQPRPTYSPQCFDFDIGHLKKSPCRDCYSHFQFPECMDPCSLLDRIQTRLAQTVVTSCKHSPVEPFSVHFDQKQKK